MTVFVENEKVLFCSGRRVDHWQGRFFSEVPSKCFTRIESHHTHLKALPPPPPSLSPFLSLSLSYHVSVDVAFLWTFLATHHVACSRSVVLGRRGFAESLAARICREEGARVATNLKVRHTDVRAPNIHDGRRVELFFFGGEQLVVRHHCGVLVAW